MTDEKFDDEADRAVEEELEAHVEAIHQLLDEYAEEHDLPPQVMSGLTFDLAVKLRTISYVLDAAKPSGSGLKFDLDRCRREVDDMFREYKKNADEFVRMMKELIDAAERDQEGPGSA
jgi:hypothetical protein